MTGLSEPRRWFELIVRRPSAALLLLVCFAIGFPAPGAGAMPLQLEVTLNGYPTHLIGSFLELPNRRLAASARELRELGIAVPPEAGGDTVLPLDSIGGLTYRYDATRQAIAISVSASRLLPHEFRANAGGEGIAARSGPGAVLNYTLVGVLYRDDGGRDAASHDISQNAFSVQLDSRVFGSWGTLANSAILGTSLTEDTNFVRLDSTWSYSDPETLLTWRVGDTISGGLNWSRSVRLGGFQAQRNFALRPDLITMPLPALAGSAAVPSTVDIYVNNVKAFSQSVSPGPFTISSLPVMSGGGLARVVVRDATGREIVTESPFYASPRLLAEGIFDFSAETGFVRRHYGTATGDYEGNPVVSASFRYGLDNRRTLEGHAEAGMGLINGGLGSAIQIGNLGVLSLAASASTFDGAAGGQVYASAETQLYGITFAASAQRTLGEFMDLAGAAAEPAFTLDATRFRTGRPSKALDTATVGIPLFDFGASLSFSFVNGVSADDDRYRIVTGTYNQRLTDRAAFYATGFRDVIEGHMGFYAGLSFSFGRSGHASTGVASDRNGTAYSAEYSKQASREPGSVGWRFSDAEGSITRRYASGTYQGWATRVEASVLQQGAGVRGLAVVDGAIAFAGGGVFLANRIDDAFAVVDVGVPDVDVFYENRRVGQTGSDGRLLVPELRSYQRNRLSIDPTNLPVDADVPLTKTEVVPADRNGIVVDLKARRSDSAVVVFRSPDGGVVPAGSNGTVAGTGERFVVGYDGRAFVKSLRGRNAVSIDLGSETCTAAFPFEPRPGTQVMIVGVICR